MQFVEKHVACPDRAACSLLRSTSPACNGAPRRSARSDRSALVVSATSILPGVTCGGDMRAIWLLWTAGSLGPQVMMHPCGQVAALEARRQAPMRCSPPVAKGRHAIQSLNCLSYCSTQHGRWVGYEEQCCVGEGQCTGSQWGALHYSVTLKNLGG
eukprot:358232-Chlamydomonas_euryale.AAC.5